MSTVRQYEVADILSADSSSEWALWSQDSGDPYSDMVTVFGHHLTGSFTQVDFLGVHFAAVNNGYSLTPVSAVSPGGKDFCIEMVFRYPGTYSSELFDELSVIDHPLFYTGVLMDYVNTNRIFVYIENAHKPNNVGINGLSFLCYDSDGNAALVACPSATFNWWLLSQTQYKSLTVGRRGQTFFMYANGVLAATTTPATFGDIDIPETDSCHAMVVPEHSCATNFLSALRVTIGACRAVGDIHTHRANADARFWPSSPRALRGQRIRGLVGVPRTVVTPLRRRCGDSALFDSGYLFSFSGRGSVTTKTVERTPVFVRSVMGNKTLVPFGNGYFSEFDGAFRSLAGGLYVTDQSFANFIFAVAFRPDSESVTGQNILKVITAGPYPTPRKRMLIYYSEGEISITIQTVDSTETPTATHVSQSLAAQSGAGKSFVVGRNADGFFFIVDGTTYTISYTGFDTVTTVYVGYSCADCEIDEFYYRESGVSQAVLEEYAEFFTARSAEDVSVSAVDDTAGCDNDETASGNVLTNDAGRFLRVTKVGGATGNVGTGVAGSNGGTFTVDADGSWTFDPSGDFDEIEEDVETSVTYHASDGATEDEGMLTVTVSAPTVDLWTPAQITDAVWIDADTVTLNGSYVAAMTDKIGGTITASQGTESARPTLAADVLGDEDVIQFDGGDFLTFGTVLGKPEDWTVFILAKFASTTATQHVCGSVNTGGATATAWGSIGTVSRHSEFQFGDGSAYRYGDTTEIVFTGGDWFMECQTYESGDTVPVKHINGVANTVVTDAGTATACAGTAYDYCIGQLGLYTSTRLRNGSQVKGFLAVPRKLTTTERQMLEGYYAHLCGLTSLLPSGHPYKSTPPTM